MNVRREICQNSRHQIYRCFTSISHHEIFVVLLKVVVGIYLLELGFGFENSLPRGPKLRCYRSLDRSANPRVKDLRPPWGCALNGAILDWCLCIKKNCSMLGYDWEHICPKDIFARCPAVKRTRWSFSGLPVTRSCISLIPDVGPC